MNTLTSAPLAPLLNYLFELADNMAHPTNEAFRTLSDQDQTRLLQSKKPTEACAAGCLAGDR